MLTVEDILSVLVSHGRWIDTGRGDKRRQEFLKYSGVLQRIESELALFRGRMPELKRAPATPTATGTATRNAKTGGSLSSLAAEVVAGMPAIEWASILWIVDDDAGAYELLFDRLQKAARRSFGLDGFWPRTIRRRRCLCGHHPAEDYLPDLVHLALIELRSPGEFNTHEARAAWFGLSPQHWRKIADRPYGLLQGRAFAWFGAGCGHIAKRLSSAAMPA